MIFLTANNWGFTWMLYRHLINTLWSLSLVQYLPGKMIDNFSWFHHFLKPIHHFTGASFYRVTLLLSGSPSFYRNIILLEQLCPPNLSPSFYDSTFKIFNIVHHFTGSLCYTENCRNQQFFHTKPVGDRRNVRFPLGNRHCSTTSIISWIRARNYSVYTLGWWVAEITPTHTMSVQSND